MIYACADPSDPSNDHITDRSIMVNQDRLIQIELPEGTTLGAMNEAAGAVIAASAGFVDWEALHDNAPDAITPAGHVLLAIAHQLSR
jgi:hypothetical protein